MRITEWVLLDTETSGLSQPIYCVEIAAQRMKGTKPDGPPFHALLNHDVDIEPQAEALHGYSRTFLRANGRDPVEVHRHFNAYAGNRPVVAYNLSFDWARVLEPEMQRLKMSPSYGPGFCALTLARRCVHETDGHKLDTLRGHFYPQTAAASHHAMDDVNVTLKIFIEIIWPRLERAGIESFPAVAEFSRKTPVRACIDRILNPQPASPKPTPAGLDPESELIGIIEGMLADDRIVDAEVWVLKHWLDNHPQHRTELAERSREMLKVALADGELSNWELDQIKAELSRLTRPDGLRSKGNGSPSQKVSIAPEAAGHKKRRLSLTKKQLEEETGAALLNLLSKVVADGSLSDREVEELNDWLLENQSADLPAVGYLIDVIKDILADGKISESERTDLFLGIEKVLPVTERRTAKTAREEAETRTANQQAPTSGRNDLKAMSVAEEPPAWQRRANWRNDPMTDAQKAFVRSLGGSIRSGATKGEASDLIEKLLGNKPVTSRQQMVMRFWSRERQPGEGPREISEWMDQFYEEDGDRKLAWELFKNESEDNGLQGDPNRVPYGVGPQYLARIKAGGESALPKFRTGSTSVARSGAPAPASATKKSSGKRAAIVAVLAVGLAAAIALLSLHNRDASTDSLTPDTAKPAEGSSPKAPPTTVQTMPSAGGTSKNENQTIVRGLRMSGIIGGSRSRVSIDGKLLGVGDVVDATRGILVHSINVETRTVTFIDLAGEIYSRTFN